MTSPRDLLVASLKQFVYGGDHSKELVAKIEGFLISIRDRDGSFPLDLLDDLLDPVSRYAEHPARDEQFLYSPEMLAKEFRYALARLEGARLEGGNTRSSIGEIPGE